MHGFILQGKQNQEVWSGGYYQTCLKIWVHQESGSNLEEPGGTWKNLKELTTADLKFHIFFEDIFAPDQAQCT